MNRRKQLFFYEFIYLSFTQKSSIVSSKINKIVNPSDDQDSEIWCMILISRNENASYKFKGSIPVLLKIGQKSLIAFSSVPVSNLNSFLKREWNVR